MNSNDRIEQVLVGQARPDPGPLRRRDSAAPRFASRRTRARLPSVADLALEGPAARMGNLSRAVLQRICRRPLASLAVAIGIGFTVGGALSFRAGRVALAVAARHVAREVLKQVL